MQFICCPALLLFYEVCYNIFIFFTFFMMAKLTELFFSKKQEETQEPSTVVAPTNGNGNGAQQTKKALIRGEVINPVDFRSSRATWRIFRIMAEFVEGYDFLSKITADVTIFGSARTRPGSTYYNIAEQLGTLLAQSGFSVITGGGPGIMEAANKGAFLAGGQSIGLNIQLPFEQRINKYVRHGIGFHFFFTRKVMLTSPSQAFVAFPGGYGTLDEVFEVMTLIQTGKMDAMPLILIGSEFWGALKTFLKEHVLDTHRAIKASDLDILQVVDTAEEAMAIITAQVRDKDAKPVDDEA